MKKVLIIGAGPVGNYAALILAKKGYDVKVYEKKSTVGTPIQCTGIVTNEINKLIEIPDSVIDNKINSITTNSDMEKITFSLKNQEYILSRRKFDNYILQKAKKYSAKFFYSHELMSIFEDKIIIRDIKKNQIKEIEYDLLIGADGPLSIVRRYLNPKLTVDNWIGIQAVVKYSQDKKNYDTYFGHDFPNFFGWSVPEGNGYSRVGIAAKSNAKQIFDNFITKLNIDKSIIKDMQGGLIPKYEPQLRVLKNNIVIIGDAATHVKATTGGGIIPGMKGAIEIIKLYEKNKKKIINKNLNLHKKLYTHLLLRGMFNKFSDKKYDNLLKLCKNRKVANIISTFNRDQPIKLLTRILIVEPKFFLYSKYIIISFLRKY